MTANYLLLAVFCAMILAFIIWATLYIIHRPSSDAAMGTMAACLGLFLLYDVWMSYLTGETGFPVPRSLKSIVVLEEESPVSFYAILTVKGSIGAFLTAIIPVSIRRALRYSSSKTP
jgi:hypothetical protein